MEKDLIVIVTKKGMIIKIDPKDVRRISRGGKGVKGITLIEGDEVVGLTAVMED